MYYLVNSGWVKTCQTRSGPASVRIDASAKRGLGRTYEAGPPRSCAFEKQKPGSLKSHGPLGGRMTAQASTSVSKSRSASIASPRLTAEGVAIIHVENLVKVYDPDIRAVDGISLRSAAARFSDSSARTERGRPRRSR